MKVVSIVVCAFGVFLCGCSDSSGLDRLSEVEKYEIELAGTGVTNEAQLVEMSEAFQRADGKKRAKMWQEVRAKRALSGDTTVD